MVLSDAVSIVMVFVRCACCDRAGAVGCIELGERVSKTVERTADNVDVIVVREIDGQGSRRGKTFEVPSEDLAAAATAFAVFDRVEEGFQDIVRALNESNASACSIWIRDGMPPKIRAMTIQVRQDEVVRLRHVFGETAFGTSLPQ